MTRIPNCVRAVAAVLAVSGLLAQSAMAAGAAAAAADDDNEPRQLSLESASKPWTGDFDGMLKSGG